MGGLAQGGQGIFQLKFSEIPREAQSAVCGTCGENENGTSLIYPKRVIGKRGGVGSSFWWWAELKVGKTNCQGAKGH